MDHVAKDGSPKIMKECTYPLTGRKVVDRIITDRAVFDCDKNGSGGLTLIEVAHGFTVEDIRESTNCDFKVASPLKIMHCDQNE
jgi:3-oxoacid CoA-transferase